MNIMLFDVDSKIPNLALMKLSAHHKALGDKVGFHMKSPDRIYASCIFPKNKHLVDGLRIYYPHSEIVLGGTGFSLTTELAPEIERLMPDYVLYPQFDYSLGYTTRGCNRGCSFCIVPKKEGQFHKVAHPKDFWNEDYEKIVFLDNNILWNPEWFEEVISFCNEHSLSMWFTQGLDIRLLTPHLAEIARSMKIFKIINFAFDWDNLETTIREKIKMLEETGFNLRGEIMFYVYVDSDEQFDSGLHRCNVIRELGTNPFVMFNINKKRSQRIKNLQRWANKKQLFWKMPFEDYKREAGGG